MKAQSNFSKKKAERDAKIIELYQKYIDEGSQKTAVYRLLAKRFKLKSPTSIFIIINENKNNE
jgi:hypothetical protein